MAFRTTEAQVAAILRDPPSPLSVLDPMIETANNVVTANCTDSRWGYSNATLELIERWLAAHYYAVFRPRTISEGAGEVSQTFALKTADTPLESTPYGQQVMLIDNQGALASLNKRAKEGVPPKPGVRWMGTRNQNNPWRNPLNPDLDLP